MERYEPGNYGQEKCGDDKVSEQRLEAQEEALLLQQIVEGVRRQPKAMTSIIIPSPRRNIGKYSIS